MKQRFFRLIRNDESLFIEPMKLWFRSFGYEIAIDAPGPPGEIQRASDSMSTGVAWLTKEAPVRAAPLKRTTALITTDEGLDAELVRDVFAKAKIPAGNATYSGSEPPLAIRAVAPDPEVAPLEQDSSPEGQGTKVNSTRPIQAGPTFSSDAGASSGRHVAAQSAAAFKATQEAPPAPRMRTMVETAADRSHDVEQRLALLPDGLEELFLRNARVNVGVKTLLLNVEPVDLRELSEELNEFAKSLGVIGRPE